MPCPVCDGTDHTVVNVRVPKDGDLEQLVGSTWDGRNVARCDDCGVLYDHRIASSGDGGDGAAQHGPSDQVNCPECGSLNPSTRDTCSHCGEQLDQSEERDPWG